MNLIECGGNDWQAHWQLQCCRLRKRAKLQPLRSPCQAAPGKLSPSLITLPVRQRRAAQGQGKPVIRKWLSDSYRAPGPLQLDKTGRRHRKADGSHVLPLCVSLTLELAERERRRLSCCRQRHQPLWHCCRLVCSSSQWRQCSCMGACRHCS